MNFQCEIATLGDIDSLNKLFLLCSENMIKLFDLHHWENQYPQDLLKSRIENNLVYKVVSDGNMIGCFMLEKDYPQPYLDAVPIDDKPFRYLTRLALLPELQQKGIGSDILKKSEDIAIKNGAVIMRLDMLENYEQLFRFYVKNGYKKIGTGHTRRYTIAFMEKDLPGAS